MLNSSSKIAFYYLVQKKPFHTAILLFLSLISTACNIIGTILLIPIFSILVGNQNSFVDRYSLPFITDFIIQGSLETKLFFISSLFILILIKNLSNYASRIISFKHTKGIAYDLKNRGIDLLCNVDFGYYQKNNASEILAKLNREVDKASLAMKSIQKIAIITAIVAMITGVLLIIAWQLTLVSGIVLCCIIWINNWLKFRAAKTRNASIEENQSSNRQIIEFLSGIRSIKVMANEAETSRAIAKSFSEKHKKQLRTQLISATIEPVIEIGGMVMILALIAVTYYIHAPVTPTDTTLLLVYLAILFRLLPFIDQFNRARLQYINTRSSLEIVARFLNPESKPMMNSGNLSLVNLSTRIEFQNIGFAYPNQAQIVLDKVNLSIYPEQTIALLGLGLPNAGSSPITDLLTRFYAPIEGKILLDGREIERYEPRSLRKAIAVVSRNTFLFDRSLAENIAYGLDNVSHEDIVTAAKRAQIYSFIEQLAQGFATRIGERGIILSETQKLKISFARAFLRKPQIVILDEPFALLDSPLDLESMREIAHSLARECTTVIVTKQLDLAKTADRIILFRQGKIIETGTHQQLLDRGTTYQRLYSMHFKTNQQSRQIKLAQKIARKLAQQNNDCLSQEIRLNLNNLLNYLDSLSQGLLENDDRDTILDESFQSAKDMLASLRAYDSKISRGQVD